MQSKVTYHIFYVTAYMYEVTTYLVTPLCDLPA